MMTYRLLNPKFYFDVWSKVMRYVPDSQKRDGLPPGSVVFELGHGGGVFWLYNIYIGWKAVANIAVWDKECMRQIPRMKAIIGEIFRLYDLVRLEACVSTRNTLAAHLTEKLGFTMEGILRKAEMYNDELHDIAVYALIKEDL